MLLGLRLKNIALIDSLDLAFDSGLTALTGETGAGKSILLDALETLFVGPNSISGARLIRSGSDRGQIEACFRISSDRKSKRLNPRQTCALPI